MATSYCGSSYLLGNRIAATPCTILYWNFLSLLSQMLSFLQSKTLGGLDLSLIFGDYQEIGLASLSKDMTGSIIRLNRGIAHPMKLSSADSLPRAHLEHTTPRRAPLHFIRLACSWRTSRKQREFSLPQCPAFNMSYGLPSNKEKRTLNYSS